jgi:hypothetical protein
MNRFFTPLLLFVFASVNAFAQSWDLKTDKGGIKIYTAKVENSSFKSVRVTCDIVAKPEQLLAVLFDINKHEEWVYNTKTSKMLKRNGENDFTFYAVVRTPWPFANRDYVAHLTAASPSPGLVTIDSHAIPGVMPENKDLVRIMHSDSHWNIIYGNNNVLHIEYTIRFDPGGAIPAWLMNMFVTEGPYQTFSKLQERVRMPAYQNAHFDFVKH